MSNEMPKNIAAELRVRAAIEQVEGSLFERAADEIERLRKERDEARRMYLASACSDDEIIPEMKRNGWDCFKEEA
jgi:protein involved in polysaccharide export with SLBB domain